MTSPKAKTLIKPGQVWVSKSGSKRIVRSVGDNNVTYDTVFADGDEAEDITISRGDFIRNVCENSKLDKRSIIKQFFDEA